MGISRNEYEFLATAYSKGVLPQGGSLLEIGEARSYVRLLDLVQDPRLGIGQEQANAIFAAGIAYRDSVVGHDRHNELVGFFVAKLIYKALFGYAEIVSLDYSGSDAAVKADLNEPFSLGRTFDVCINCGTTEHIFNQYQAFKTIHDHTAPGGSMIHWQPIHGFHHINHGMFLPQPGMFYDLAHANGYRVAFAALSNDQRMVELNDPWVDGGYVRETFGDRDNYFYIVLQKTADAPFRAPQQYESRTAKADLAHSWEQLQATVR